MKEIILPIVVLDDYPNEQAAWKEIIEEARKEGLERYYQIELVKVTLQRSFDRDAYIYLFRAYDAKG